jgi:hypothetical protein
LSLAPLSVIRSYGYDLIEWCKRPTADDGTATNPPNRRDSRVIFWRDRKGRTRRTTLSALDIAILSAIETGGSLAFAEGAPCTREQGIAHIAHMHALGVVDGVLPSGAAHR